MKYVQITIVFLSRSFGNPTTYYKEFELRINFFFSFQLVFLFTHVLVFDP